MRPLFWLGRAILGGFFVYNGLHHFQQTDAMAGYAASKGVPQAKVAVLGSGAMALLGGASLVLGVKHQYGAALIAAFLAGVTPQMHKFWEAADPNEKMAETVQFSKNMALLGSALMLAGLDE